MGFIGKSKWIGVSGREYIFDDYTLDTVFAKDIIGNYIFCRTIFKNGKDEIYAIYIGEGIIKDRIEFRIKDGKVLEKECDHVSVRILGKGESGKWIEEDLLAVYFTAYEPIGCNIKTGG